MNEDCVKSPIEKQLLDEFKRSQTNYIEFMRGKYTSWNVGMTEQGQKTYDFSYDRRSTVAHSDVALLIDNALSSGNFFELDDLYVKIAYGACRHPRHTGKGDRPSKKDRCVSFKQVLNKDAMSKQTTETNKKTEKVWMTIETCKRRFPIEPIKEAALVRDAHNKKLIQLQFESNDKYFNGHDPFAVLHMLHNCDDKALPPDFLEKPPKVDFSPLRMVKTHV